MRQFTILIILVFLLVACVAPAHGSITTTLLVSTSTPNPAGTPIPLPLDTNTPADCKACAGELATMAIPSPVIETDQPAITPTPNVDAAENQGTSQACPASMSVCILDGHFLMQRPIAREYNDSVDNTYLYGTTQSGAREPHHGVEFPNELGTPVLAAANGEVVYAGNDKKIALAWVPAFYGNVVVIAHHFQGLPQVIFSLYGHLSAINVSVGQQVSVGEQIGQVGSTGKAIGSHLHFEVRLAKNDYLSNRNPELWLTPLAGTGVLTGRIVSSTGNLVNGIINVQRINNGVLNTLSVTSLVTYNTKEVDPVKSDDVWDENFAAGELPAGDYRLSMVYDGGILEQVVQIQAGKLTFVRFVLK